MGSESTHIPTSYGSLIDPTSSVERGINGLQGLIIALVVAGFLVGPWAPVGSFFGLDLLLTLIGFSATRSLWIAQLSGTPTSISEFYSALIKRLLPLVWILSALVVVLAFAIANDSWMWLRRDVLSNVLFVSDITEIVQNEPVAENFQRAPLLWHLWLFSLITQLGLLLPLIVALSRRWSSRLSLPLIGLTLSLISMTWLGYLLHSNTTPESTAMARLWMGLDTRSSGFFLGMTLASWCPLTPVKIHKKWLVQALISIAFVSTAVVYVYLSWNIGVGDNERLMWAWPLAIVIGAILMLLAALVEGTHSRWLRMEAFQWLGDRSLAIYVWSWPILELMRLPANSTIAVWLWELAQVSIIFGVAELTHRIVVYRLLQSLHTGKHIFAMRRVWIAILAFGATLTLLYLVPVSTTARLQSLVISISHLPISRHLDPKDWQVETQPLMNHQLMLKQIENAQHLAHPAVVGESSWVLVIGDGLLLNAKNNISKLTPDTQVSADLNVSTAQVMTEINELRDAQQLAPQVVLILGNTRAIGREPLLKLLDNLNDRERVFIVNNSAYGRYAYQNNRIFLDVIKQYRHVVLIDWLTQSTHHPEYFGEQRLTLTSRGQEALTVLVRNMGGFSASAQILEKPYMESLAVLIDRLPLLGVQKPALGLLHPITTRNDLKIIDSLGWYSRSSFIAMKPQLDVDSDEGSLLAAPLVRNPRPIAPDVYWDRIADCETGSDWKHRGRFAGGLGIYSGTWISYGGLEFAKTADLATRDQQITVANRISTQGYYNGEGGYIEPVGFTGWGCANLAARPVLIVHTASSILAQPYRWLQQGALVEELEAVLGLPISGIYDLSVHQAHVKALAKLNLPIERAPDPVGNAKATHLRKRRATLPNYGPFGDH